MIILRGTPGRLHSKVKICIDGNEMDAYTPAQTTELISRIGAKKAKTKYFKVAVSSFISGPLLGFGYVVSSQLY
jgi:formate/nitrite transporter FocA (FNT family)